MPLSVKAVIAIRQHQGTRRAVKRWMRKSRSGEMRNGFFKNCLIVMPEIVKISLLMLRV